MAINSKQRALLSAVCSFAIVALSASQAIAGKQPAAGPDRDGDSKPDKVVDKADKNGDGKPDKVVDKADKNGDGKPDKVIDKADKNGDGKPDKVVDKADKNGDGKPDKIGDKADKDGDGKPDKSGGPSFSGNVSWYGVPFHGRKTASGRIFDMNKLTSAHRKLPFFTKVLVENPKNGKSCVIEVTDRGPFVKSRVMDVSRESARRLGTLCGGIAFVDCTVMDDDGK